MRPVLRETLLILRNDLRISVRSFRMAKLRAVVGISLLVAVFLLLQALFLFVFSQMKTPPPLQGEGLAWSLILFFLFGMAVGHTITVLFERADLDLLLSSPVSPRSVLCARLATITVMNLASVGLLVVPLIIAIATMVDVRYFLAFPVWILAGTAVTALTISMTLGLVRLIGAKRARTWAQIFGGIFGASFYLASQGANLAGADNRLHVILESLVRYGSFTYAARAARGEWLPFLLLFGGTLAAVYLTLKALSRAFLQGAQEASAITVRRAKSPTKFAFTDRLLPAAIKKDLRLIIRDPLLLSQVLPSVLYTVPAIIAFSRSPGFSSLAPLALVIAVQCSMVFSAVAANGEECLDLIVSSPTPEVRLRIAKMLAGMAVPCAVSLVVTVLIAVLGHPYLALATAFVSLANAAAASWIQVVHLRPATRKDLFKPALRRTGVSTTQQLLAVFLLLTAAAGLTILGHPRFLLVGIVLLGVNALAIIGCFTLFRLKEWSGESWKAPTASTS